MLCWKQVKFNVIAIQLPCDLASLQAVENAFQVARAKKQHDNERFCQAVSWSPKNIKHIELVKICPVNFPTSIQNTLPCR